MRTALYGIGAGLLAFAVGIWIHDVSLHPEYGSMAIFMLPYWAYTAVGLGAGACLALAERRR